MPIVLLVAVAGWHLVLRALGTDLAAARAAGVLLPSFPDSAGGLAPPWTALDLGTLKLLAAHLPTLLAIALVSVLALLLNTTGLELAVEGDLDIDRELRAAGVANLVSAFVGGPVGYQGLSASLLGLRMGAASRAVGLLATAVCIAGALGGGPLLGLVPRPVLGALLVSMGGGLLVEWVWDGWWKLGRADWAVVVGIAAVVAGVGVPEGVVLGMGVAMVRFVASYSRLRVIRHNHDATACRSTVERAAVAEDILRAHGRETRILRLEGYIFFGTAHGVLARVRDILSTSAPHRLLLDLQGVPAVDTSASATFNRIRQLCAAQACTVVWSGLSPRVHTQLERAGLLDGPTFATLDEAVEWAEEQVLGASSGPVDELWTQLASELPADSPR